MPQRQLRLTTPTPASAASESAAPAPGGRIGIAPEAAVILSALDALRSEMEIPASFPADVLREAEAAAARDLSADREDLRHLELVTIDPPGSMDLDQALHLSRASDGYVVHYAIADVAAFVEPGSALDTEVNERGMTLYGPSSRTPLHPPMLSEGAASLLPEQDRPAAVWKISLDAAGEITDVTVGRATVRSRSRLTYTEAQALIDGGSAGESLDLLRTVGQLREKLERERGGASLDVPEQEVLVHEDGSFGLELRSNLPVEGWNAQISLLTGIAAAQVMREGGVGIFRTLPDADPRDVARLRRTAKALGIDWPKDLAYGALLATLDSTVPRHAAFLNEATTLFRGAAYAPFGGTGQQEQVPDDARHAAIAAEYAHVTAPLRRLVDRYGTEICLALSAGAEVPRWVRDALPGLPRTMARTGQRAGSYERASVDIIEAALLAGRVGELFDGVIVDVESPEEQQRRRDRESGRNNGKNGAKDGSAKNGARDAAANGAVGAKDATPSGPDGQRGQVVLADPAVRATVDGPALPLGDSVRVTLREASVERRSVAFDLA